jgi:hypothetical protein
MLGESDLAFVQVWEHVKFGWFNPSPAGETLMGVLAGTGAAFHKVCRLAIDPKRSMMRGIEDEPDAEWPRDVRRTSAYADLASIYSRLEAMELELRDPDGKVVETDDIYIDDTEWKMSLVSKRLRRKIDRRFGPEPWQPDPEPFPRYQIQIRLRGVPRRCIDMPELELPE